MLKMSRISEAFKEKRIVSGMKKVEMARDMNISINTYLIYETGRIPDYKVKEVCDYLGIEVADILEVENES